MDNGTVGTDALVIMEDTSKLISDIFFNDIIKLAPTAVILAVLMVVVSLAFKKDLISELSLVMIGLFAFGAGQGLRDGMPVKEVLREFPSMIILVVFSVIIASFILGSSLEERG